MFEPLKFYCILLGFTHVIITCKYEIYLCNTKIWHPYIHTYKTKNINITELNFNISFHMYLKSYAH